MKIVFRMSFLCYSFHYIQNTFCLSQLTCIGQLKKKKQKGKNIHFIFILSIITTRLTQESTYGILTASANVFFLS